MRSKATLTVHRKNMGEALLHSYLYKTNITLTESSSAARALPVANLKISLDTRIAEEMKAFCYNNLSNLKQPNVHQFETKHAETKTSPSIK